MRTKEIDLFLKRLHPNQQEIADDEARFIIACMGRRFGKTFLGQDLIISSEHGAVNGKFNAWCAPSYKILEEAWRELLVTLRPLIRRKDTQQKRIELITEGVIDFWTLSDIDVARGRKYHMMIIDEAAAARYLEETWTKALRPTLTDFKGRAYFFSTPRGINYFKDLFDQGMDPEQPDWSSYQMPTSANPYIEQSEIETARKELPQRVFEQEYLAQFIDDGGLVFRHLDECVYTEVEKSPEKGAAYVAGIDWAKNVDFTVVTIFNAKTRKMVHMERFNQIDYVIQADRVNRICKRWNVQEIQAEKNSMGDAIIDFLKDKYDLPLVSFMTTNKTKSDLIEKLAVAFENLDIGILNNKVLKGELMCFSIEQLPSGNYRYGAPEGMHDDCVISLALAWKAVLGAGYFGDDGPGLTSNFDFASEWS